MIRWTDEELVAAGIDRERLAALVRRLRTSLREMEAMSLNLHFDETGDACLVHESRSPFDDNDCIDRGAAIVWLGLGFEGGHW